MLQIDITIFISLKRIELYELSARNKRAKLPNEYQYIPDFNEPSITDKYFFDDEEIIDSSIKNKAISSVME